MIIEVSLTTVGNIAAVMMVLAKNFHKISIHSVGTDFSLFTIGLQDTATGEVTQRIVESIECRINSCMTKHGKDGINFTRPSIYKRHGAVAI